MGKPFSNDRLQAIRRLRKARRLFKQQSLFAYHIMCEHFPAYSYADFLSDLSYRRMPKKRIYKSRLNRYGRYMRVSELIGQYQQSGNLDFAILANRLWEHWQNRIVFATR